MPLDAVDDRVISVEHSDDISRLLLPDEDISIVASSGYVLSSLPEVVGFFDVSVSVGVATETKGIVIGSELFRALPLGEGDVASPGAIAVAIQESL